MAKTTTKVTPAPTKIVPVKQELASVQNMDPEFVKEMMQDAGMGVSTRPDDNITPSVRVLQALSPQITGAAGAIKVEGAEAGDFLLGDSQELIPGDEGFWFQPTCMTEWWFEFIPRERGGGFVARYQVKHDDNDQIVPPNGAIQSETNPFKYTFEETNNNCTHYRFVPGIMWREGEGLEYVIPFMSTGHTIVRTWNTKWMRQRFPNGQIMPAFSNIYRLTTKMKTNKHGSWHLIETSKAHLLTGMKEVVGDPMQAYRIGRALALAFAAGERVESTDVEMEVDDNKSDDEIPF